MKDNGKQIVAIHLHVVKEFDPNGDPSTVHQRRQKWKKAFANFLNASGIQNDSQKRATLLHLEWDKVQDIFERLDEVGTTYEQTIYQMGGHLISRRIFHLKDVYSMRQLKNEEKT